MGIIQEYKQDQTGGEGKKRPNPGMSGDYNAEEFSTPQVPNPVKGASDVQPAQPTNSQVGMGNEAVEESMVGVDENPLGTNIQVQTTKFKDGGVPAPKGARPTTPL